MDWITTDQAQEILGYTTSHIGQLVRRGVLKGHRCAPADHRSSIGRRLLISRQSVEEFADTRVRKLPDPPPDTSREGDIRCPWCLRGCASQEDLDLHMRIVHPRLAETYEPPRDFVTRGHLSVVMVIE